MGDWITVDPLSYDSIQSCQSHRMCLHPRLHRKIARVGKGMQELFADKRDSK